MGIGPWDVWENPGESPSDPAGPTGLGAAPTQDRDWMGMQVLSPGCSDGQCRCLNLHTNRLSPDTLLLCVPARRGALSLSTTNNILFPKW